MALRYIRSYERTEIFSVQRSQDGAMLQTTQSVFGSWTNVVMATFERELNALRKGQEEREFLATGHGSRYGPAEIVDLKD